MEDHSDSSRDQERLNFLRKGLKNVDLAPSSNDPKVQPLNTSQPRNGKEGVPKEGKPSFEPTKYPNRGHRISLPDEVWLAVLESPCTFSAECFNTVMLNLIQNPNLTSSHLFRADLFYDSNNDPGRDRIKHMQKAYRPLEASSWPGFDLDQTIVRQLIPRNPKLDKSLVQTCHFFRKSEGDEDEKEDMSLVVYMPHASAAEEIPFYHPTVSSLAFLHTSVPAGNSLTLLYRPFPDCPLNDKLERTALRLLQTVHKHGQGAQQGYEKRVHLDQIIPQKRYQDTYSRLKGKYGKRMSEQWVEVTDPGKHVFEDIGIAAFLIELWRDMYQVPETTHVDGGLRQENKPPFPGFVDIGCGNGLLVHLLLSEGYDGWGFDARQRKTWSIFSETVQERLQQRILVPSVLQSATDSRGENNEAWHDGMFKPGTFIVSNHADELTVWTPLIAWLNDSAFIAIPCCSHDLAGARFRAPATTKSAKATMRLPQQTETDPGTGETHNRSTKQAAETASLKKTEAQKKLPSAYSTLCSYVASLAADVGFEPEQEVLRIPSTRNSSIIGRKAHMGVLSSVEKAQRVMSIVEEELKTNIEAVGAEWTSQVQKLVKKPSSGH